MKVLIIAKILILTSLCLHAQEVSKQKNKSYFFPNAFHHKPGLVISPYKPFNIVNVKHLKPGNLAYDPSTAAVDPKTGKKDYTNAKIFRVPNPISQVQESKPN